MQKHIDGIRTKLAEIAAVISRRRVAKRLTQGKLGELLGLPQSHISRLERGQVDLRTSSLLNLARALDMEVMLVPRRLVPAVRSLIDGESEGGDPYLYRLEK